MKITALIMAGGRGERFWPRSRRNMPKQFLTLTDDVEYRYKVDNVYHKASEGGMRYDDPTVNVDWGSLLNGIEPVLSEKDQNGPTLEESDNQFIYEEDK